jgi:hypothetical protein
MIRGQRGLTGSGPRRGRLNERGAATVEWLALAAAVMAILAAVYVALPATGIADSINRLMASLAYSAGYQIGQSPDGGYSGGQSPPGSFDPGHVPTGLQQIGADRVGKSGGGGGGGSWGSGEGPTSGIEIERKWHKYDLKTERTGVYDPRTGEWRYAEQITLSDPADESGYRAAAGAFPYGQGYIYYEGERVWVKQRTVDVDVKGKLYSYDFETLDRALLTLESKGKVRGADGSIRLDVGAVEVGGGTDVTLDKNGLAAERSGKAGLYLARARGDLGKKVELGQGYSAELKAKGEAYVGATVEGKGALKAGKDGVRAGIGGSAFVGGKAEGSIAATPDIAGVKATIGGKAAVSYGLGANFDLDVGFHNGKMVFKNEAGLTVGLGASYGVSFEVDLASAAGKAVQFGKTGLDYCLKSFKNRLGAFRIRSAVTVREYRNPERKLLSYARVTRGFVCSGFNHHYGGAAAGGV